MQESLEFGVAERVPSRADGENLHEGLAVGKERAGKVGVKEGGAEPFEALGKLRGVEMVDGRGSGAELMFAP